MPKAEGGSARIEVVPPVVGIGYSDRSVLSAVTVRVADERCFPVVVDSAVGDGDTSASVSDVDKTIITGNTIKLKKGKQYVTSLTYKSLSWSLSLETSTWSIQTW
jgi:hypothetical protein